MIRLELRASVTFWFGVKGIYHFAKEIPH